MLTIPVIALTALWAYAAATTIGPYLAQRTGNTDSREIGAASQALLAQLTEERADTLAWQTEHGPRDALNAQRARTDGVVSQFEAGLTHTAGIGGETARSAASILVSQLGTLTRIRTGADSGRLSPLAAFSDYNSVADAYFQYIRTQLVSDTSVPLFEQGQAVIASGQALEMVGREAAVVGGALAGGGTVTTPEYRQFVLALDQQRFLMQTINSPQSWQLTPNPFQRFYASQPYAQFAGLEDQIAALGAGAKVPVSPATWQPEIQSTLKSYGDTELAAVEGIGRTSGHVGDVILLRLIVVGGAGLAAVLIVGFLLIRFSNRITRELTSLYGQVRAVAEERLPSLVRRLSDGHEVDPAAEAPSLTLDSRTLEVTQIAEGFSEVQRTAVEAAVGQAELRNGVSSIFRSLARRNQSLLQRQLRMLDEMERGTEDPDALSQLFRLDHLTTRMRRQSEGLIILSGAAPGRRWNQPVPIIEVLRGATGEIEDYVRVDLATDSEDLVAGAAVADLTHLLAELIENAAQYSPPSSRVLVKTGWGASGFIVEVEDRGLGIPAATMAELNQRLAAPPEFDLADRDQLGLLVVSRLAHRHGIKVTLRGSPYGGAAAIVLIPKDLVVQARTAPRPALARSAQAASHAGMSPYPPMPVNRAPDGPPPPERVPEPRDGPGSGYGPGSGNGPGDAPGPPSGLPRRQRQANLAPQLREAPPPRRGPRVAVQASALSDDQIAAQSAERARSLISSVQQGWRSGRTSAGRPNAEPGGHADGRTDGMAGRDQSGPEGDER
ncbi:MAG TPA: sensor histidine kinase [Streptosporangiaceae bacterium]